MVFYKKKTNLHFSIQHSIFRHFCGEKKNDNFLLNKIHAKIDLTFDSFNCIICAHKISHQIVTYIYVLYYKHYVVENQSFVYYIYPFQVFSFQF